jgi:hypothetical protein
MTAADLADWWDTQKQESEEILGEWVSDNPQWWAIGIATGVSTAMTLGSGLVDALRLGEGAAQGGVSGFGRDALRLLVVVGPLARGGATLGRFVQTRVMIRLAVATKGVTGPCTFTAVNNATAIVGGRGRSLFLTAHDAATALGKQLGKVGMVGGKYDLAAWIDELVPFLTQQGVRLQNLCFPRSLADVTAAAASRDGVVIFAIEWTDMAGTIHYHSMIAVRTIKGVQFADYGGKFMSSLSELTSRGGIWPSKTGYSTYTAGGMGSLVLAEGMKLIGAFERYGMQIMKGGALLLEGITAIETPGGVELAFPVAAAAAIESASHEPAVVKASFAAFKARKAGRPMAKLPPVAIEGRTERPARADLLTGVQYRLNAAGFGAGPVDGINGPRTQRAVNTFQKTYNLRVDGIAGPETQKKLVEICGF